MLQHRVPTWSAWPLLDSIPVLPTALPILYPARNPSWQQATQQAVDASWRRPFLIGLTEVCTAMSLHPLHVTPKPCRVHRHPDHHSRSLLAQFGLTPKSRHGLAASDPSEAVDAL